MERPQALTDNVSSSSALVNTSTLTTARQCYMTPDQRVQFYSNQESSTSNQTTPNQPITNYIDQALQQPSYSGIATNNQALQQPSYSGIATNNIPPPRILPYPETQDYSTI